MLVKTILYQTQKDGEWLKGYYVGKEENADMSIILTEDLKAYEGDIWDYKTDYKIYLSF